MKKFLAAVFAATMLVFMGVVAAPAASAASTSSVATAKESVSIAPAKAVTNVSPVKALSAPKIIGVGGGIKPAWLYVSCYWSMNGDYWCWRYACTYFERVALGCKDGWYRVHSTWYA